MNAHAGFAAEHPEPFDYVIVGGGSAGSVLAHRLSEDQGKRVLLLEAGPEDDSFLFRMPLGFGKTLTDARYAWHYPSEPEPGTANASRTWLRGKVLGGSSAVNGMIYTRGQPEDFDAWEAEGATGWGWPTFLAAYRAIEDHALGADEFRGAGGPLHVSIGGIRTPVTEAILQGFAALGTPIKPDVNRPDQEGIGYSPMTVKRGRRVSSAAAFLHPVRHRRNLSVWTGCLVERVILSDGRAMALEVRTDGGSVTVRARREIILAAGTVGSPKILQLSGIGPAQWLAGFGIPVVRDCPGVGANLSEHKGVWLEYRLNRPFSHNVNLRGWRFLRSVLQYQLLGAGPLATSVDISGFVRASRDANRPDTQISVWALTAQKDAATLQPERFPAISAGAWQLRPASRGSIMIRSRDPAELPIIRPNFLTVESDRAAAIRAFRYLRSVFEQPAVARYLAEETLPGDAVRSDDEIIAAIASGENGFHATGTCRMGSDPGSVVDPRLKVRGISGLRVVDCSVMPSQVSSGANAPVMALAWHAASLIQEDNRG